MFEHVYVLNREEFSKFIQFSSVYYKNFDKNIELFRKGTYIDSYYQKLKQAGKFNEEELKYYLPNKYGEDLSKVGWEEYLRTHDLQYIMRDNAFPKKKAQLGIDNFLGER